MTEYHLHYLGMTFDGADSYDAAVALRDRYVADIMADRLPGMLDRDDFASPADCRTQLVIVPVEVP